jgi:Flp pilus assembly protein TadB
MTALTLGLVWAVAVGLVAGHWRRPTRLPSTAPGVRADRSFAQARASPVGPGEAVAHPGGMASAGSPVRWLGARLRRLAGRRPDPDVDRRVGWAVIGAVGLVAWAPPLAIVPPAWALLAPTLASRRADRAHEAAVADQLPDIVDLLALTTAAGLPIAAAVRAIGRRPGGPLGTALDQAAGHIDRGGTTADALVRVVDCAGPTARSLADALAAHDRYGTPLAPALERVAIESRLRRRRQAEEAARRLPVTLLFPLVLTTLPAFALLTVVPLLAGSFGSLSP